MRYLVVFSGYYIQFSTKRQVIKTLKGEAKSSSVRISNRPGLLRLGKFIYDGFDSDNIGFRRKFEKYQTIASIDLYFSEA